LSETFIHGRKSLKRQIKVGWRRVQASFGTWGCYLVSHFFPHKYHSSATHPHGWMGTAPWSFFHHVLSQSVWPNWPPKWLGCLWPLVVVGFQLSILSTSLWR
jgi:hypothetical protein